ncbi:MAG: recombinase family protein [Micromonosporaceae bacterium]|nr:recombinase family protein [Micromonosporaceae bacterium]
MAARPPRPLATAAGPGGAGPASPWATLSRLSGLDTVPVAGLLRVSQEQLQDVRGSLIRQVDKINHALPHGWSVARWYLDVESGRLDLDERGHGAGHLTVTLPVERAGGLADLLTDAARRDCPFTAVVAEGNARVARYTHYGTKVEHDLARHGIELFMVEEGINLEGGKATKVLMRRVNQAISEWHALNVLELAWDGMRVHTTEGYNTGRAPYGYHPVAEPHPAPARRARGLTRSRLDIDPVRGPVVTLIYHWRVEQRLTYHQIAARLNADPDQYPPPIPLRPETAIGQWTWSNIRQLLANPKYTGYMVWNRTTTRTGPTVRRKKSHRPNPTDQWVWSPKPTHPPLVPLNMWRQAQDIGRETQGSRSEAITNTHPATTRTYLLRGLIRCGICGHRMQGAKRYSGRIYYRCTGPRNSAGEPTRPDHPGSLYIREDILLPALTELIATRVFGPHRHAHLANQHRAIPRQKAAEHQRAIHAARRRLDDIAARQHNLIAELEQAPADAADWRASIRQRHQQLTQQRTEAEAKLAELTATQPIIDEGDPALLEAMPQAVVDLARVPPALLRQLFDTLQLAIRLDNPRRAHITLTLTLTTPEAATEIIAGTSTTDGYPGSISSSSSGDAKCDLATTTSPVNRGHVLLSRIRATSVQDLFTEETDLRPWAVKNSAFVRLASTPYESWSGHTWPAPVSRYSTTSLPSAQVAVVRVTRSSSSTVSGSSRGQPSRSHQISIPAAISGVASAASATMPSTETGSAGSIASGGSNR